MREGERRGIDPDQLLSAILVSALVALVGARLAYIVESRPGYYLSAQHIGEGLSLWQGGLSFFGGIAGAAVGCTLYCVRYRMPILTVFDVGALAAPLGQGLGRIGNVINGDLPGYPTHGWGLEYTNRANPLVPLPRLFRTEQPVAIYETVLDLALFAALLFASRRLKMKSGQLVGMYLSLYGAGELVVYAFRDMSVALLGLKEPQLVALIGLAAGLWLLLRPYANPAAL